MSRADLDPTRSRRLLAAILAVYLLLALGYGAIVPLFETPDEHLHYFTAAFIAREGRLPTTAGGGLMGQEAAQPPLYYTLAALVIRAVPDSTLTPAGLWPNPMADAADPRGESLARPPINVNLFVHGPAEAWPWGGYALAVHLVRIMSTIMGLGTLLCLYGAGRAVWPEAPSRALLATALVACLPQFAFIHAAVSNDPAITLFSAAALWQLLRIRNYESGIRAGERARRVAYGALGVIVGLAMLSKAAGLLLLVWCGAVAALLAWRGATSRRGMRALGAVALVAIPALAMGGWLLARNQALYGDPTAAGQFFLFAGGPRVYTLRQVWHDMSRVWPSLFAWFGWMNVRPPAWVWSVWNLIAIVAVAGAAIGLAARVRRPRTRFVPLDALLHPATLLTGWFLLVAAAWLQFMLRTPADQGRLFFPALLPLALGAAWGLSRWPRPWIQLAVLGPALVTTVYSLAVVIPTAYARPPLVAGAPSPGVIAFAFPDGPAVVDAGIDTPVVRPGDWVWTTIRWRDHPATTGVAPLVQLEAFGRAFHRIGTLTSYHGRGNYPATLWPAMAVIDDRLAVRLDADAVAPVEARLTVRLSGDDERIDIGTVKVVPREWPGRMPPLATLGDGVELAAVDLSTTTAAPGETLTVRLRWQVTAPPGPGLRHVFVHLGDPTQPPLAQTDGPVMGGEYPMALWATGEVFDETIALTLPDDLPPGDYPVHVGLYDYDSGARLPVTVGGERRPTDVFTANQSLTVR